MRRLAYFVSHPIQYQAPLLRLLSEDPDIDLTVFFFSDFSLKAYQDEGFGQSIKWDVLLTEGYQHHFLKCWGPSQRYSYLSQPVAINIYKQLKDGRFDAVWVHGWSWLCSLQAIVAAKQLGIPVLLRGESNGLTEPAHLLKRMGKKVFLKWLFRKVDAFLCIGALNKSFYQHYGIEETRLFSVPYAVDNNFFQQQSLSANVCREALRQSLDLDPGRQIILYAAKFIDVKRPQDLLTAYRALSPDGVQEPTPYLLFVGDGSLRIELEAIVKETGWNSIRFLGFRNQSQMPAMYDLCDVFVLPSRFEPWGLAINEVMNAGKAVVVSEAVGCTKNLVQDRQNGLVFPVGDVEALRDALVWTLANAQTAGKRSLELIQNWSFREDIQGIKSALELI
jgi:glycosyltransferase involved in cell wall biosynthesis